jgi:histone acetyltransferase MYST1
MENQEDPAKNAAPIINPVIIKHNASSKSSSISSNPKTPRAPLTGPGSGKPIDVHPYIRGSVIEVRYSQKNPDNWFDFTPDKIYLCDIIDRMPLAENTSKDPKDWRYYVHYRELNRRMDEWISGERVVSPPSVGNAKARALKKKKDEEERERVRRERAKDEQCRASLMASVSIRKMGDEMSGDDDVNSGDERRKSRRSVLRRAASSDGGSYEVLDAVSSQLAAEGGEARLTRRQRRKTGDGEMILSAVESSADNSQSEEHFAMDVVTTLSAPTLDEHEGMDEAALKEHEEVTKVKNVATLELGEYQMDTWYFSPLPKEFLPGGMIDVLYVDEFSLNFFTRKIELQRYHERELPRGRRHPPGNEIYRCGNLSMFEVDGYEQRIYCQNLCYIAKLFLDHKTLYYDVDPFLFYVLCEVDERGEHISFLLAIQNAMASKSFTHSPMTIQLLKATIP